MTPFPVVQRGWATCVILGTFAVVSLTADAFAQTKKPRVPPGLDPGGVAVAIAAPIGLPYTAPHLAQRLARDGEGELIGWNFVDDNRRPFADTPGLATSTMAANIVLHEAGSARLVVFRTKNETLALGRLMVFTAKGPAKVLLLFTASDRREDWAAFTEAATHFKHVLIIVPAGSELPGETGAYPAGLPLDTILTVRDSDPGGNLRAGAHVADIAAPANAGPPLSSDRRSVGFAPHAAAAARIAALAARLVAAEPKLEGAALKARILALAKPLPSPHDKATRHGWIAEPQRPFRVE